VAGVTGSRTVKELPWPNALATWTVPPWASTMALAMARPRPARPGRVGPGLVRSVEALENMREIIRRDALARVGDGKNGGARLGRDADPHAAAGTVVGDGIAEKIGHDLTELLGVAAAAGGREIGGQVDALLPGHRTQELDGLAGHAVELAGRPGGRFAGVESRQRQQGLDEAAHALRGALTGGQAFAVFAAERSRARAAWV